MPEYISNQYKIYVNKFKKSIKLKVINDSKAFSIFVDDQTDKVANTNCDNNITLCVNTNIHTFIINCLDKKINYNYKIIENDESIDIYFNFKYEDFDFNYTVSLNLE